MRAFTKLRAAPVAALAVALATEACRCDEDAFRTITTTTSELPNHKWNDGVDCSAPKPDVVQLADDTFIFRQPLCVNFEGRSCRRDGSAAGLRTGYEVRGALRDGE